MTAFTGQYGRYVLNNLIESLDKPYESASAESGLMRLSTAMARSLSDADKADLSVCAKEASIRGASTRPSLHWPTRSCSTTGFVRSTSS